MNGFCILSPVLKLPFFKCRRLGEPGDIPEQASSCSNALDESVLSGNSTVELGTVIGACLSCFLLKNTFFSHFSLSRTRLSFYIFTRNF